jgi:hypothetical protein
MLRTEIERFGRRTVTVEDRAAGGCSREVWVFLLTQADPTLLLLDAYDRQERPSPRHKWRPSDFGEMAYVRLPSNHRWRNPKLTAAQVPLPDAVKAAAIKAYSDALHIEIDRPEAAK